MGPKTLLRPVGSGSERFRLLGSQRLLFRLLLFFFCHFETLLETLYTPFFFLHTYTLCFLLTSRESILIVIVMRWPYGTDTKFNGL